MFWGFVLVFAQLVSALPWMEAPRAAALCGAPSSLYRHCPTGMLTGIEGESGKGGDSGEDVESKSIYL